MTSNTKSQIHEFIITERAKLANGSVLYDTMLYDCQRLKLFANCSSGGWPSDYVHYLQTTTLRHPRLWLYIDDIVTVRCNVGIKLTANHDRDTMPMMLQTLARGRIQFLFKGGRYCENWG